MLNEAALEMPSRIRESVTRQRGRERARKQYNPVMLPGTPDVYLTLVFRLWGFFIFVTAYTDCLTSTPPETCHSLARLYDGLTA